MSVITKSRVFETPAFPNPNDSAFFNAVVKIKTQLAPQDLLDLCHSIEADMGRERGARWAARVVDLDILAYGDDTMGNILPDAATYFAWHDLDIADQMDRAPDRLIVPHPRVQDRSFVLVPMADVAPDWCHPVHGLTTAQMLAARPVDERRAIKCREIEF